MSIRLKGRYGYFTPRPDQMAFYAKRIKKLKQKQDEAARSRAEWLHAHESCANGCGKPVAFWDNIHYGLKYHGCCSPQCDAEQQSQIGERVRQKLNAMRDDAQAFNSLIDLPVRWQVGVKDVTPAHGRTKAPEHIYLLEALAAGRLKRAAGDFLCTSAGGTKGKRWSSKIAEHCYDGDGAPYQPKVTCKACLSLAERWM